MRVITTAIVLVTAIVCLAASCESGSGSGTDGVSDTDEPVLATNLDCENNWDRAGGYYGNGGLEQTLTVTFTVPLDYDGEEYVYNLGAAFGSDNSVPSYHTPELVGELFSDDEAGPLIPGQSFTITTYVFSRLGMYTEEFCGQSFYAGVSIYYTETSYPANMEWLKFSEKQYQVGGDPIVIDVGELVSGDK
jgi:hypothetical protein